MKTWFQLKKFFSHRLEIAVFVSGAVVMIFELVGSRLLAPYLGSSLITWTSIIGIILASLSFGTAPLEVGFNSER